MQKEKFIKEVRKYPLLYDLADPKYSNTVRKEKAWREIANVFSQPGSTSDDGIPTWAWIVGGVAILASLFGGVYFVVTGQKESRNKSADGCVRINPARLRWPPDPQPKKGS